MQLPEHDRQGIPHHLLDVADATDDFSAGVFFQEARRVTADILQAGDSPDVLPACSTRTSGLGTTYWSPTLQRGKTPVLVGGTGFYLRWYIYGKPSTPISNEQLAAAAKERLDQASARLRHCRPGHGIATWSHVSSGVDDALRVLLQAWEHAAAELQAAELTPQQKWEAGVALVKLLGDPESAAECDFATCSGFTTACKSSMDIDLARSTSF